MKKWEWSKELRVNSKKRKKIIKFGQILVYLATLKTDQLYHNFYIFLNCPTPIVYDLGEIMCDVDKQKVPCEQNVQLFKRCRCRLIHLVNYIFNFYISTYYVDKFTNIAW